MTKSGALAFDWWSLNKDGALLYRHAFHLGKLDKGKKLFDEILRFTPEREIMIDVGAHIGYMGAAAAPHFVSVHCFEPAKDCFDVLSRNLGGNRNVTMHNMAVGPFSGMCDVHNDPDRPYSQASRFVVPADNGAARMVALDDLPEIKGGGLLKIDVEGFEEQVLVGAERYIATYRPTIFMETAKNVWAADHPYRRQQGKAERWLLERGYRAAKKLQHDTIFVPAPGVEPG
jgi:FkbM family methyltransferase